MYGARIRYSDCDDGKDKNKKLVIAVGKGGINY